MRGELAAADPEVSAWVTGRVGLSQTGLSGGKADRRAVCGIWGASFSLGKRQSLCIALRWRPVPARL